MADKMEVDEQQSSVVVEPPKEENASKPLTLEVLAIIKRSQGEHGLKHGDYRRYRQYCAKRLRRVRKAVGFIQAIGSGGRNNRGHYQKKPLNTNVVFEQRKDPKQALRLLYIPLIAAERAWAYAQELKQSLSGSETSQPRQKYHMLRRLQKAVAWSLKLRSLCNQEATSNVDARTKLETTAYAAYMRGLYYFERERWQQAANYLTKTQTIYEKLAGVINDEDVLAVYKQRVEEIKPTLRYCQFNVADDKKTKELRSKIAKLAIGDDRIDKLLKQTADMAGEGTAELVWLGKTIFVKHEKVRNFVATFKDPKNESKWSELAFFEEMIFECRDCLQLLRDSNQDKSSLYQYLTYVRLDLIIRRNLKLIEGLTNVSDILRQYESVIGCLNEMKTMPLGQHFSDEFQVVKFVEDLEAQILVYKAYRCYYIGHVPGQEWKEMVALLHRSAGYCREALENESIGAKTKDEMRKLLAKADAEKFAIYSENIALISQRRVEAEEEEIESKEGDEKSKPLIERLGTFVLDERIVTGEIPLVTFPPNYRATPCKPLFFDLALNHVRFPNIEKEANVSSSKAGLTGMVKGWLGGWGK